MTELTQKELLEQYSLELVKELIPSEDLELSIKYNESYVEFYSFPYLMCLSFKYENKTYGVYKVLAVTGDLDSTVEEQKNECKDTVNRIKRYYDRIINIVKG